MISKACLRWLARYTVAAGLDAILFYPRTIRE
jgi:hypothetical protein